MIAVTNASQRMIGTVGYIASFDLSDYEPRTIEQVQVQATDGTLSEVETSSVAPEILDGYCDDAAAPDFAFNQKGNTVDVFLKLSLYPWEATVYVEFTYHRNGQNIDSIAVEDAERLDIPQPARELFKARCLKLMYEGQNKEIPYDITNNIRRELAKLGL
jgi:hypothetical protein